MCELKKVRRAYLLNQPLWYIGRFKTNFINFGGRFLTPKQRGSPINIFACPQIPACSPDLNNLDFYLWDYPWRISTRMYAAYTNCSKDWSWANVPAMGMFPIFFLIFKWGICPQSYKIFLNAFYTDMYVQSMQAKGIWKQEGSWGEYLGPREMRMGNGEGSTISNFIVCTVHLI